MKLKLIKKPLEFKDHLSEKSMGFVPTMGALHEGHEALIKKSLLENDETCVSIFVNPKQFNNPTDFESYPNKFNEDLEICEKLGVNYVFMPSVEEIYHDHETIEMTESVVTEKYEGAHRPGHFNGVLLVLMKLFNIVNADRAYFGEKDFQQLELTQKMTEQFFMKTKVVPVETVRDEFGLALSSRNLNLSKEGLERAQKTAQAFLSTQTLEDFKKSAPDGLELEYYGEEWGRVLMAHYIEGVRLIDNKKLVKI
jgi:pantoate--beta-alanine ligase